METASRGGHLRVAARLASFYRTCPPIAMVRVITVAIRLSNCEIRKELTRDAFRLPVEQVSGVCSAQRAVLEQMADMFDVRVKSGKDCGGSWRSAARAHLSQTGACNNRLSRILARLAHRRSADELAFLAFGVRTAWQPGLRRSFFFMPYSEISGDWPDAALMHFYQKLSRHPARQNHDPASRRRKISLFCGMAPAHKRIPALTGVKNHQDSISSVIEPPV